MDFATIKPGISIAIMLSVCMAAGCGGTKVLKDPQPILATQSLASASDRHITATLDWIVVRDGPGSWARNADWDEYRLRISNQSGQHLTVTQVIVVDSLQTRVEPQSGRRPLVKASKDTARRYKNSGVEVKAGRGAGTMMVAGAAATVVGVSAMTAVAYSSLSTGGTAMGAGGTAAGGLLLLGPALAIGGVVRGINNSRVNNEIEFRQTGLPLEVPAGEELGLTVFFPLAPSPRIVEIIYASDNGTAGLAIDISQAVDGLHLELPSE